MLSEHAQSDLQCTTLHMNLSDVRDSPEGTVILSRRFPVFDGGNPGGGLEVEVQSIVRGSLSFRRSLSILKSQQFGHIVNIELELWQFTIQIRDYDSKSHLLMCRGWLIQFSNESNHFFHATYHKRLRVFIRGCMIFGNLNRISPF